MGNFAAPKFSLGQTVKFVGDNDGEAGKVLGFSFSVDSGWAYQISARELDIPNKQVLQGIKHCKEDELVAVKEGAAAQPTPSEGNNPADDEGETEGVVEN